MVDPQRSCKFWRLFLWFTFLAGNRMWWVVCIRWLKFFFRIPEKRKTNIDFWQVVYQWETKFLSICGRAFCFLLEFKLFEQGSAMYMLHKLHSVFWSLLHTNKLGSPLFIQRFLKKSADFRSSEWVSLIEQQRTFLTFLQWLSQQTPK